MRKNNHKLRIGNQKERITFAIILGHVQKYQE